MTRASLVAQLVKKSAYNEGDVGSIPGLGRSSGEGKGYPLQYSGLENSMDNIVHGVAKSWTRLRDFHLTHFIYQWIFVKGLIILKNSSSVYVKQTVQSYLY